MANELAIENTEYVSGPKPGETADSESTYVPLGVGQTRRSGPREFSVLELADSMTVRWHDTRALESFILDSLPPSVYVSGPQTDAEELAAGTRLWLERVPAWSTKTEWLRIVMEIHERVTLLVIESKRYEMLRRACVDAAEKGAQR